MEAVAALSPPSNDGKSNFMLYVWPPEAGERDFVAVFNAFRAFAEASEEDDEIPPALVVRATIELSTPSGVRIVIGGDEMVEPVFAEMVEAAVHSLKGEFATYRLAVGNVTVKPIDVEAVERDGGTLRVERTPHLLAQVREAFERGGEDARQSIEEAAALLCQGELVADTEEIAWAHANDLAFMSFGIGNLEMYEALSGRALEVFPEEPMTLLTRALWHATQGQLRRALNICEQVELGLYDEEREERAGMYSPEFLDAQEEWPRPDEMMHMRLGDVIKVYTASFGSLLSGETVSQAMDELNLQ
jgi:hypothetical protein